MGGMSQAQPTVDLPRLLADLEKNFAKTVWREETGSTNADLAQSALAGETVWPDRSVLMANSQIAGKGRLGRSWEVPAGSSMISSVLVRPATAAQTSGYPTFADSGYGWLSILAGVALCHALRAETGVKAELKWPNDVVVDGRKLAGILAQLVAPPLTSSTTSMADVGSSVGALPQGPRWLGPAVVVGLGMNVSQDRSQLPVERATSLLLEDAAELDRTVLLPSYLNRFADLYSAFLAVGGNAQAPLGVGPSLHTQATTLMATIGLKVRAELPDGSMLHGTAMAMALGGELVIEDAQGTQHAVSAGDVVHLRRDDNGGVSYA